MGRASFCHQLIAGFFTDVRIKYFAALITFAKAMASLPRPLQLLNQAPIDPF